MDNENLISKIFEWKRTYGNIFAVKIGNEIFIIRPLTRKEFKSIYNESKLTDSEKEEIFCQMATLYPENYDFKNCVAGIPSVLCEKILSESLLLTDGKARVKLNEFRDEMKNYENQIMCIITEAFPTIRLDEIEEWDMYKILHYLSRAEFVLHNIRGIPIYPVTEEAKEYIEKSNKVQTTAKNTSISKAELEELKRKFPEIDWENDALLKGDLDFEKDVKMTFSAEDAI